MDMEFIKRNAKRIAVEGLGWVLVVVGIAALVLPGPGLLALFAGMTLLATQYEWAARRLEPVRRSALKTAAASVAAWHRITLSVLLSAVLVGLGILWCIRPSAPAWWPLASKWWLLGGWSVGATLILSGLLALLMIIYSLKNFRGPQKP